MNAGIWGNLNGIVDSNSVICQVQVFATCTLIDHATSFRPGKWCSVLFKNSLKQRVKTMRFAMEAILHLNKLKPFYPLRIILQIIEKL